MILHRLGVYSLAQFTMLAGYLMMCLSAGTTILTAVISSRSYQLWAGLAGLMMGVCFLIAFFLRLNPRWNGLVIGLSLMGAAAMLLYVVFLRVHQKSLRSARAAQSEAAAPTGEVWPPPPVSLGRD